MDFTHYGVAYGIQNSSSDADIKWTMFTDAAVLDILKGLWRRETAASGGVTDHGALTGLGDDDHPQYVTDAEHAATDHTGITGVGSGSGELNAVGETVSTVDANQNDYNPTNLHTIDILRFTSFTAARTITGLNAGTSGEMLILVNNTGQNLVLPHESASSSANNRFAGPGAATVTVRAAGSVMLVYANTRWRILAI